jgi:RHS repeat-associated protein
MQPQTVYIMSKAAINLAEGTGSAKAVFYLSNHRGDTLAAYRDSSTLVARYRYDAFGNQRTTYCMVDESENAPRYTFSTKEFLSDAKLYLYAYRVYDPQAGRWTQRDPIDYQDSVNLYAFCVNSPVQMYDTDGRAIPLLAGACFMAAAATPVVLVGLSLESWRRVNHGGDYAVSPFWYTGSTITFRGRNYDKLSEAGKHIVDLHEALHYQRKGEVAAHQTSYEEADKIWRQKKWAGIPLTKKEMDEVLKLRKISEDQLRQKMTEDGFNKWLNQREEQRKRGEVE